MFSILCQITRSIIMFQKSFLERSKTVQSSLSFKKSNECRRRMIAHIKTNKRHFHKIFVEFSFRKDCWTFPNRHSSWKNKVSQQVALSRVRRNFQLLSTLQLFTCSQFIPHTCISIHFKTFGNYNNKLSKN